MPIKTERLRSSTDELSGRRMTPPTPAPHVRRWSSGRKRSRRKETWNTFFRAGQEFIHAFNWEFQGTDRFSNEKCYKSPKKAVLKKH